MRPANAYSWPYDAELKEEIPKQLNRLKELGIDQVKIGYEIELRLPEEPEMYADFGVLPEPNKHWLEVRNSILDTLKKDPIKNSEIIKQVASFNAREVLMYDLLHLDERTSHMLHPLRPDQYYDGRALEAKIDEKDPLTAIRNHEILMDVLFEKAAQYGLDRRINGSSPPCLHFNISFWKNGVNINDPSFFVNPSDPTIKTDTAKIVEGIARALYDTPITFFSKDYSGRFGCFNAAKMRPITVGPSRMLTMRLKGLGKDARFEISLHNDQLHQHTPMIVSNILSGALFGLDEKNRAYIDTHVLDATPCKRIFCHNKEEKDFAAVCFTHVLNGSYVDSSHKLQLPEDYIAYNIAHLATSLGWIEKDAAVSERQKDKLTQKAIRLFKAIRLEKTGNAYRMHFPASREVKPEIRTHMEESIDSLSEVDCLRVQPGYPNNSDLQNERDIVGERVWRAMNSEVLKRTLSPDVFDGLVNPEYGAIVTTFGQPSAEAKKAAEMREKKIMAMKSHPGHSGASRGSTSPV